MDDRLHHASSAALKAANTACIRDAVQCREWLARIASDEPCNALEAIREQLTLLLAQDVAPATHFEMLELMWAPVAKLQAAAVPGYANKAIPLATHEYALAQAAAEVRLAMAAGYERCLAEQHLRTQCTKQAEALICQRALGQLSLALVDYARAYIAAPVAIWKRLHSLYRHAEARGITDIAAAGAGAGVTNLPSCRATYLHALLFDQAQPYSLTPVQIENVARWLGVWTEIVNLHTEASGDGALSALAVDIDGADALKLLRHSQPGPGLRHLETQRLGEKLRQTARALRDGAAAAEVGLATNLSKPALEKLLTILYVQWCSAGTGRASERSFSTSKAMVTLTVPAMHYYISGRAFRQPGQGPTREEDEDLHVFGHITSRTTQKLVSQRSSAFEPWSIANESVSGMFALCREPDFRTRIAHGQLLGLMRRSDKPIELVTVQRLMVTAKGELEVGVRRVEGTPQPVAVRVTALARPGAHGSANSGGKYERALLLPPIPEKSLPPRLFLQPGWYQPQITVDMYASQRSSIRLLDLIEAGPNFEQVTFEIT